MALVETDGILLVDKKEGQTSYGVVKAVKSAMGRSRGQKVGHAGTLDPFATGLLVILLGQGTKLSRFIMSQHKVYLATVRLGVETDTFDHTGTVVRTCSVSDLSEAYIREKARAFVGTTEQTPPMYSAVKYKGERAYRLARQGLKAPLRKRNVTVHSLRVLSITLPDVVIEVACSSGTYMRSLASDLGGQLGVGGRLQCLRRLTCGSFNVKDALPSDRISKEGPHHFREKIIPLREALPEIREIEVDAVLAQKVRQGYKPNWELSHLSARSDRDTGGPIKLITDGKLVAILERRKGRNGSRHKARTMRVFH